MSPAEANCLAILALLKLDQLDAVAERIGHEQPPPALDRCVRFRAMTCSSQSRCKPIQVKS
jgi:hypothetical protein